MVQLSQSGIYYVWKARWFVVVGCGAQAMRCGRMLHQRFQRHTPGAFVSLSSSTLI